ncbi:TRM1 tRNA methyltransferase 1 [Echinococcus multilocularis]|uniref:tRNA (guanine(26)-N(2))-dimethyltransferase n=1 Tax=Echinococcus multilocularis TaxID=6211 RepID=A0A068YKV7_ECHMU|nr:TRM1 tRNA methyltransferase 1 [Echinococcus multilocularis]
MFAGQLLLLRIASDRFLHFTFCKRYIEGFSTIMAVKEGSALINLPEGVFYNPVQEFNRDLTVAVVKHYAKIHLEEFVNKGIKKAGENGRPEPASYLGLSVLEALAASGLRSVRFAKEVPLLCKIVANDLDPEATKLIAENAKLNAVEDVVVPSCADAVRLMHDSVKNKFHVVDIDPYGTASPFLDAAVQCLFDGGLLCVTCTDMAVLCGTAAGTAYGKYGGVAIKMAAQHEQGLRLLLHAIQQAASRHDKVIEPLLALSVDFYARVFVRVRTSPSGVRRIASRLAIIYSCTGCQVYRGVTVFDLHLIFVFPMPNAFLLPF